MGIDVIYTNGVIAAQEKYLLKDRIFKLCEGSAPEAFRALSESGFGSGAAAESAYDFEKLVTAEGAGRFYPRIRSVVGGGRLFALSARFS